MPDAQVVDIGGTAFLVLAGWVLANRSRVAGIHIPGLGDTASLLNDVVRSDAIKIGSPFP